MMSSAMFNFLLTLTIIFCLPFLTGNALGYVRMVRSASMYYCSEAVKYLPDFDDLISFEDCAGKGLKVPTYEGDEEPAGKYMGGVLGRVDCIFHVQLLIMV
jgi:hypothetical protein